MGRHYISLLQSPPSRSRMKYLGRTPPHRSCQCLKMRSPFPSPKLRVRRSCSWHEDTIQSIRIVQGWIYLNTHPFSQMRSWTNSQQLSFPNATQLRFRLGPPTAVLSSCCTHNIFWFRPAAWLSWVESLHFLPWRGGCLWGKARTSWQRSPVYELTHGSK